MKNLMGICFALGALTILVGCAGAVKYPNYYALHLPAAPDPPVQEDVHTSLAIREFRSPTYLRCDCVDQRSLRGWNKTMDRAIEKLLTPSSTSAQAKGN